MLCMVCELLSLARRRSNRAEKCCRTRLNLREEEKNDTIQNTARQEEEISLGNLGAQIQKKRLEFWANGILAKLY